ncbi:MAG: ABC transporter substrate-binding protein [Alphaproteobacteria bacterium]|nr:ABC transporter substrate-binding protein [Alphaproteobacteria bacterium]
MKALAAALLLLWVASARAAPLRVVSLNLCTDQLLVLLAPEQAVALSPLARDPALSVVAATAQGMRWVRPDVEAVLALAPDLVLAGPFGAQTTLAALAARGVRIERTAMPQDFLAIRAETRRFAALLGAEAAGARLIARMDRVLAEAPPGRGLSVLPLQARGYVADAGSLAAAVITAAGLRNAGSGRRMALEAIVLHPPDRLVIAAAPDFPSLATDLLRHPALADIPRITWPPALLACGGPWTADAVALLAETGG